MSLAARDGTTRTSARVGARLLDHARASILLAKRRRAAQSPFRTVIGCQPASAHSDVVDLTPSTQTVWTTTKQSLWSKHSIIEGANLCSGLGSEYRILGPEGGSSGIECLMNTVGLATRRSPYALSHIAVIFT